MTPQPTLDTLLPLQQSPAYARTLRALGREAELIKDTTIGQMLLVSRDTPLGTLRMGLRGPLWHTTDADARVAFLRRCGARIIGAETPDAKVMKAAGYVPIVTGGYVGVMNLTKDLAPQMHQKWRNRWRFAERAGLTITATPFHAGRDMWLMSLDRAQQRVMGYRNYPRPFTFEFAAQNPGAAVTYVAYKGHKKVAGMVFLLHRPTATYHLGWSGEDGRSYAAHNLILVRAAQDFAAKGLRSLDLGQIDTHRTPGLARFKLGSGAIPQQLGGTWLRMPRLLGGWRDQR